MFFHDFLWFSRNICSFTIGFPIVSSFRAPRTEISEKLRTKYHFLSPFCRFFARKTCAQSRALGEYVLKMSLKIKIDSLGVKWQRSKVGSLSEKSMRIMKNHWKTTEIHQNQQISHTFRTYHV